MPVRELDEAERAKVGPPERKLDVADSGRNTPKHAASKATNFESPLSDSEQCNAGTRLSKEQLLKELKREHLRDERRRLKSKGLTDLGDLTLGAPPIFVSGRVVDDRGKPLPGLKLRLSRQESQTQSWWDRDYEFTAKSDEDGRFEALGTRPGAAFRVTAESDGD